MFPLARGSFLSFIEGDGESRFIGLDNDRALTTDAAFHDSLINTLVLLATLPVCVYLMTAFCARLPRELVEAARMGGVTLLQIWWNVMLPIGKPALLTLGILNTLYCWNDVLISLPVLQKERAVMVGIAALRSEYTTNVPLLCARIALAAAPIIAIHIFFQRQIVDGIAVGAVKG